LPVRDLVALEEGVEAVEVGVPSGSVAAGVAGGEPAVGQGEHRRLVVGGQLIAQDRFVADALLASLVLQHQRWVPYQDAAVAISPLGPWRLEWVLDGARVELAGLAPELGASPPVAPGRLGEADATMPGRLFELLLGVLHRLAEGRGLVLFISAKTASVHVSNILAKLGVANRAEAAPRLGLGADDGPTVTVP
jgi:hypothetical protein